MSNKSIGSFLAELRKEKGITQKDLADYLGVSDKTVSHWECDKYSPDISVIPILAEFFGVTCDEILKGEKKVVEERKDISETADITIEADCNESSEDGDNEPHYNDSEALSKEREYARFARIRLHNAFSKMKLTNIISIFITIVLWAVSYTVIQLIEHKIGIHNFELYATIGSAFCSAAVGAIIILSSHLKFLSMVNMCPFEEVEFLKWRRMAKSIIIVPLAILVLICIIAVMMFMPLHEAPLQTATDTLPYHEEEFPQEVDPSIVVSGDVIVSVQNEDNVREDYASASGEVILTSNP